LWAIWTMKLLSQQNLLTNIRKIMTRINIHCNAGVILIITVGVLAWYKSVLFHENGIATIRSWVTVRRNDEVKFNSQQINYFKISKKDKTGKKHVLWKIYFAWCSYTQRKSTRKNTDHVETHPMWSTIWNHKKHMRLGNWIWYDVFQLTGILCCHIAQHEFWYFECLESLYM